MIINRKKIAVVLGVLMCFMSAGYGRSKQEVIPAGSWIFDSLSRITMDCGRTGFVFYAPMTIEEIEDRLNEIDYDSLSPDAVRHYDRVIEYFKYETPVSFGYDILKMQAELDVNLEGYYKTEDEIAWVYDRYKQKPMIYMPLKIILGDYCAMSMDIRLGVVNGYKIKNDNYTNIPINPDGIDLNFPHDYYFAAGHKITDKTGFSLIFGTMGANFNRSLSGCISQSEYFTGATYADLSLYSPNFRYKMNLSQFNPDRYMYSHEIGMILGKKLQFTVKESILVYAPMELRYMAPWNIFHGIAAWKDYETRREGGESNTCDFMSFKVDLTPVRNLRFYGIFAMDQFQMPNETDDPDDVTPRGFAFQAGTEVFIPAGEGSFHIWLEGTYTDPYMYIKASPNWSLVRYYQDLTGPKQDDFYTEWYGTPWGPDTVGGEISIGYEKSGKWSLTADYLLKACGKYSGDKVFRNLDWDWKNRDKSKGGQDYHMWVYPSSDNDLATDSTGKIEEGKVRQKYKTPHGIIEYVNRVSLKGTLTPVKNFSFMIQPSYTHIYNLDNKFGVNKSGFEIAVSMSKKFF